MNYKNFTKFDFKKFHPSGSLSIKLKTVGDLMTTGKKVPFVKDNIKMDKALEIINYSDVDELANLLNKYWEIKRELPNVSNKVIDEVYDKALKNGAIGGKLLGAGNGGFMLFICKNKKV